ncbi:flagellar hook capping FlgD N-terminal domain-containing protein [Acidithiobacillus thiooxidans]|uniref:flagellar hook capping FlgD N-terminal domain-containing protein n=1 Tax=Acidithiobacillus thiooxidans TaxID=930 RepID=UPI00098373F6|nr:flagellar hook capping FlgD N-terminal domain-containing protein [Acidithiobacillus thiooxidans]
MSITSVLNSAQPISQSVPASTVSTGVSTSTSASGASASGQMLTEQDFLTLLVTQLQNQDPTQPASDTQLAEEMAGFTTANGMSSADTLLQQISTDMSSLNSALGIGGSGSTTPSASSSSASTSSGTVTA